MRERFEAYQGLCGKDGNIMIITLEPELVVEALRAGLIKLGTFSPDLLKNAEIKVYRKGKFICAKIILK